MALTQVSDAGLKTPASDLQDNEKIILGTGNDLEIYHSGTNTFIANSTGPLKIRSDTLELGAANGEQMLQGTANAAVNLYYDGVKKFETTSYGSAHTGIMRFEDSGDGISLYDSRELKFGNGDDLKIYHNGSNSKIDNTTGTLYIQGDVVSLAGAGGSENLAVFTKNGSCDLYYDNTRVFNTQDGGVAVYGTEGGNCELFLYADEGDDNADKWKLKAAQDGTFFYLQNLNSGSWETNLKATGDGGVELYYDNSKKLETSSGGVTISGNATATSKFRGNDDVKLSLGDGEDLQIYHDGNNSFIKDTGTGRLSICTSQLQLTNAADSEVMIKATEDGAVELYHDGTKRLETSAAGGSMHGNLYFDDNGRVDFGAGNDLQIYHSGTHSFIKDSGTGNLQIWTNQLSLLNAAGAESMIQAVENGQVELYYDDGKKFETTSAGVSIAGGADGTISELRLSEGNAASKIATIKGTTSSTNEKGIEFKTYSFAAKTPLTLTPAGDLNVPDSSKIQLGDSQDCKIYHDGTYSRITNDTGTFLFDTVGEFQLRNTNTEKYIKALANGAIELYYDNSKKLETTSVGTRLYGRTDIGDSSSNTSERLTFGVSQDFQLYHDGGGSYITNSTGILMIQGKAGENSIRCHPDAQVELYHDHSIKLATTSSGCTVTGSVTETSDIALKTNIEPLDNVLDKIQQITGYKYQFKDTGHDSMGVTAQDVEKVFPELVHGEEGTKTLQYSGLIGALVESVKELSNKVAALEAK